MCVFVQTIVKALEMNMNAIVEPKMFRLILTQLQAATQRLASCQKDRKDTDESTWNPQGISLDGSKSERADSVPSKGANGGEARNPRSSLDMDTRPKLKCNTAKSKVYLRQCRSTADIPVVLSQQELALTFAEADPSAMVSERGRLMAKTSAQEEASEMADALCMAFMEYLPQVCAALGSDVSAAQADMPLHEYLIQVSSAAHCSTCVYVDTCIYVLQAPWFR